MSVLSEICLVFFMIASALLLTVPFFLVWDLVALIIYIAARKKSPEKRKKAEKGFIIPSAVITLILTFFAAAYAFAMIFDYL